LVVLVLFFCATRKERGRGQRERKRRRRSSREEERRRRCDLAFSFFSPLSSAGAKEDDALPFHSAPFAPPCAASNAPPHAPEQRARWSKWSRGICRAGARAEGAPRARQKQRARQRQPPAAAFTRKRRSLRRFLLHPSALPPKSLSKALLTCSLAMISTRSFCQTPTHLGWGVLVKGRRREG